MKSEMLSWWRILLAVALQVGLLAVIAGPGARATVVGTELRLRTVPVDPYDPLAGYYVTLGYEVERMSAPLVDGIPPGSLVWLRLTEDDPAQLLDVRTEPPEAEAGVVSVRGVVRGGRARLVGVDRFYVPEDDRTRVEAVLRANRATAVVVVKVIEGQTAVVRRLEVGDEVFETR